MEASRWRLTFRVRPPAAATLNSTALRAWWSAFPDQPDAVLTDGSLLVVTVVEARNARHAALLGRHRVTEFFPGSRYRLEHLTLMREEW